MQRIKHWIVSINLKEGIPRDHFSADSKSIQKQFKDDSNTIDPGILLGMKYSPSPRFSHLSEGRNRERLRGVIPGDRPLGAESSVREQARESCKSIAPQGRS